DIILGSSSCLTSTTCQRLLSRKLLLDTSSLSHCPATRGWNLSTLPERKKVLGLAPSCRKRDCRVTRPQSTVERNILSEEPANSNAPGGRAGSSAVTTWKTSSTA